LSKLYFRREWCSADAEREIREDPMGIDREERIRHRAYSIWQDRGRPHGEDLTHWLQASDEFESADTGDLVVPDDISVLGEDDRDGKGGSRKAGSGKRRKVK
jgi:hypothetical protein